MPIKPPHCKICGEDHYGPLCPKYHKDRKGAVVNSEKLAKAIEARPVKLGSKGKAIMEKRGRKKK
jgi:hypothetical protein